MKWMFMAVLTAGLCCGCGDIPGRPTKTDNPGATVEVLFKDADGYTVKRFYDKARYHYYVTPGPAAVGKNGSKEQGSMIPTGDQRQKSHKDED